MIAPSSPLLFAILSIQLLSGCSRTDNEPGPGGVTVSEAKALDDAATMLESRRDSAPPADETDAPQKNGS